MSPLNVPYERALQAVASTAAAYGANREQLATLRRRVQESLRQLADEATELAQRVPIDANNGRQVIEVIRVPGVPADGDLQGVQLRVADRVLAFTITEEGKLQAVALDAEERQVPFQVRAGSAAQSLERLLRILATGTEKHGIVTQLVLDAGTGAVPLCVPLVDLVHQMLADADERAHAEVTQRSIQAYGSDVPRTP